jgi:DNA-binding Lrp family transcriptional regulator
MKLTRRQVEFITHLHELNQEKDAPIHYSILAERLGVSPFTAYDMLCLLEEKGMVTSVYRLSSDKSGPGRAERLFFPMPVIQESRNRFLEQAGALEFNEKALQQHVLECIRSGDFPDIELAEEMLARIPPDEHGGELRYCSEVMTVIALRLRHSKGGAVLAQFWPGNITEDDEIRPASLFMLAGFAFGILAQEFSADADWVNLLSEHVRKYYEIVSRMAAQDCSQLGKFVMQLFAPLISEAGGTSE